MARLLRIVKKSRLKLLTRQDRLQSGSMSLQKAQKSAASISFGQRALNSSPVAEPTAALETRFGLASKTTAPRLYCNQLP